MKVDTYIKAKKVALALGLLASVKKNKDGRYSLSVNGEEMKPTAFLSKVRHAYLGIPQTTESEKGGGRESRKDSEEPNF